MENFINEYLDNIKGALLNGDIDISVLVNGMGCSYCPLREACGKAADEGDNRTCEMFIREETKA